MIVTFWSEDDGDHADVLARTVSWLARWGYATLCVDWSMPRGSLARALGAAPSSQGLTTFVASHLRGRPITPDRYVQRVELPGGRSIDLLPAGTGDRPHGHADWQLVYRDSGLADTLEGCRVAWRERYDVVLINTPSYNDGSRGITLAHLPDVVVPVYTAATAGAMAETLRRADHARDLLPYGWGRLVVVPYGRDDADAAATLFEPWLRAWVSRDVAPADVMVALRSPQRFPVRSLRRLAALLARELADTANIAEPSYVAIAATARVPREPAPRRRARYARRSKVPKSRLLELARAAVARTAPDELRMFDVMGGPLAESAIAGGPVRPTRIDVLGFGIDIDATLVSESAVHIALRLLEAVPIADGHRLSRDEFYVARDAGLSAGVSIGLGPEQVVAIVDAMLERLSVDSPDRREIPPIAENPEPKGNQPDRSHDRD